MRSKLLGLLALTTCAACAAQAPSAASVQSARAVLSGKRRTNILATIPGFASLPAVSNVSSDIDIHDIQGDILIGMQKQKELFVFFSISDAASFKQALHDNVSPFLTSTTQLLDQSQQPITALNLALSQSGLTALGFDPTTLNDALYANGQFADATDLGDPQNGAEWESVFKGTNVHGVFLVASDNQTCVDAMETVLLADFGSSWNVLYTLQAAIRPPPFNGHEMFGFKDGISQPAVDGFQDPHPGQHVVDPGVILTGVPTDTVTRPSWATNGAFLAFRQLEQKVPEFTNFVSASAAAAGMDADLLGARMVGRWKSGAPVDLSPTEDNTTLANDPNQNNNFDFSHAGFNISVDETHCPFDAHVRKTNPRADLTPFPTQFSIIRAGIPYGPEVSDDEASSGVSNPATPRGLAFVAYQAQIAQGFHFLQETWADNPDFVFGKIDPHPGYDPIIGQALDSNNDTAPRFMDGYNPANANDTLQLPNRFIISRGGEYFFSPSISAIINTLSV